MRLADYSDIGTLLSLNPEDEVFVLGVREKFMRTSTSVFFLNDAEDAAMCYDFIAAGKWSSHINSKKSARGKNLWRFAVETAAWMIKHKGMEFMFCFVKKENRLLKIFGIKFGERPVADLGEELLYITPAKRILKLYSDGWRL
jgi:ornithine carbamoyltransferase